MIALVLIVLRIAAKVGTSVAPHHSWVWSVSHFLGGVL